MANSTVPDERLGDVLEELLRLLDERYRIREDVGRRHELDLIHARLTELLQRALSERDAAEVDGS
jgi:hypothetical protein